MMVAFMAEDVTATCGMRGQADPDRVAVRHGQDMSGPSGASVQIGYKPHHPTPTNVDQHQPTSSQATAHLERQSAGQRSPSGATSANAALQPNHALAGRADLRDRWHEGQPTTGLGMGFGCGIPSISPRATTRCPGGKPGTLG